jgi:hypothetical protein
VDNFSPIVRFRVTGTPLDDETAAQFLADLLPSANPSGKVYAVHAYRSAERPVVAEAVPGRDVVVARVASGPVLVLHPETAKALLAPAAQNHAQTRDSAQDDAVPVTSGLPWTDEAAAERGGAGPLRAALQWFGVIRIDSLAAPARHTALAIAAKADSHVREGLYQLQREALPEAPTEAVDRIGPPAEPPAAPPGIADPAKPLLVLLHGTFVNTAATFGKLWKKHPALVGELFTQYEGGVFAFEHPTVTCSPVANALALAGALPEGAVVHLLTHSRGGIVAEILVRASTQQFGEAELMAWFGAQSCADDRRQLLELAARLREKRLSFERVVRVACPARGTLLASSRLDAYLSVVQWLMRTAGLQVSPLLLSFLREVAREGTRPEVLPGLAAMVPDSPLIKWLNSPAEEVANSLYVVAGDSGGDSLVSWVRTLMADAFYWTDNDLVVQTRSMYGGMPRQAAAAPARFMLLEGGEVSHFTYFDFKDSAEAVADALRPKPQQKWRPIGTLSWRGEESGGVRAGTMADRTAEACAVVIPDFFGSHLHLDNAAGERLWLTGRSLPEFHRLAVSGNPESSRIKATDLVSECYGRLCERLRETHELIPFPYDWRLGIESSVPALAEHITQYLNKHKDRPRPVRIIAHGMGALLVRALHMKKRELWDKMLAIAGSRILLLGAPNAGTWTPLQVLSGNDTLGNVASFTGPLFDDEAMRRALATMPGFIELQAGLLDPAVKLGFSKGWEQLERAEHEMLKRASGWHRQSPAWATPDQVVLADATIFWRQLDEQLPALAGDLGKIVTVVGAATSTPSGVVVNDDALFFKSTAHGDGRVAFDSARLFNEDAWCIEAEHGRMPGTVSAFGGLLDLLVEGTTAQLAKAEPVPAQARSGPLAPSAPVTAPKTRRLHGNGVARPPFSLADLFTLVQHDRFDLKPPERLSVRVYHGDLRFVRTPLLVGHYQSLRLSGAEAVVDTLVGGRMSKAVRAGIYPERVGSYQIFENGRHHGFGRQKQRFIPRPKAAIVVGLGEEGKLSAQQLSFTLRNGILAYAERLAEIHDSPDGFEIAATLVGSGGTGITVSNAAVALVQAITDANVKLREVKWPQVTSLEIVDLYLDRATDAWRVLKLQAEANPARLSVDGLLREGEGSLRRPLDSSYRGAAYDFISVAKAPGSKESQPQITYSLDTKRARTEVRGQVTQGNLLRDLVLRASNSSNDDPLIGRTLFNLLVPVEIEPYLAGSSDMVMELDDETSALPWELLDTEPAVKAKPTDDPPEPWAIRCKVIRKLQVKEYRMQLVDASRDDNLLIIGEPKVSEQYGELPGARREAEAVERAARAALDKPDERVKLLASQDDAHTIVNELFARNYRLVHIAGHGTGGAAGGVVLSGGHTFLGPNEIRAMRVTPELVFVNCCYSARRDDRAPYDRVLFAASLADELINIGVRCVIAAGWAVEDGPAEKFATTFYSALFGGARFIDAVGEARRSAWLANRKGNTWAAYQCYGDPEWTWRDAATASPPLPKDEYAGVASPITLTLVLQSIAAEALFTTPEDTDRHRARLEYLEKKFTQWHGRGDVAQEFGNAYAALPDRDTAIKWFDQARKAQDGRTTLSALELYAEQCCLPGARREQLEASITILGSLTDHVAPTMRRYILQGIALKRLSQATGDEATLDRAQVSFTKAACFKDEQYNFYPARATLECALRSYMLKSNKLGSKKRLPPNWCEAELSDVGRSIEKAAHDSPDFWSIVAQTQFDMLKSLLRCQLQRVQTEIEASLKDLHNRISTHRYWIYVYDDAFFLLEPYLEFARGQEQEENGAAEAAAAAALITLLAGYAGEFLTGANQATPARRDDSGPASGYASLAIEEAGAASQPKGM